MFLSNIKYIYNKKSKSFNKPLFYSIFQGGLWCDPIDSSSKI